MKTVVVRPEAEREIDDAAAWYESKTPGKGGDFKREVLKTLTRVATSPHHGSIYHRTNVRFIRVHRFSYVIYYLDKPDYVWVVAVSHGRRRASYWRDRLSE